MKQLVSLLLLSALIVTVAAAPSIVTNPLFQAEVGQYRNTAQGGFEVRDNGNSPAGSNATAAGTTAACGDNILISTLGGAANTVITSGDLVYSVKVLARSSPLPPSNTCFTVTLSYNGTPLCPFMSRRQRHRLETLPFVNGISGLLLCHRCIRSSSLFNDSDRGCCERC